MGDNEPKPQSLSLQLQEIAQWARESSVSCREGSPEPGGQQGRRSPQSSRAEPLAADAKGDQHGAATLVCGTQLSQQWSGACLSSAFKMVCSTLLGLFDKCLGTPDAKCGICSEAHG